MKKRTAHLLMLTSLLAPLFLTADALTLEEITQIGKETTDELHHRIQSEALKHKGKGIVDMAQFCIDRAQAITHNYNQQLQGGISIKRISLKNRNDANKAEADEIPILTALEQLAHASAYLPEYIIQINENGDYKYYQPIMLAQHKCVTCHGKPSRIPSEVRTLVQHHYPNDKATSYDGGDFRGAFLVEIRQQRANAPLNPSNTKE